MAKMPYEHKASGGNGDLRTGLIWDNDELILRPNVQVRPAQAFIGTYIKPDSTESQATGTDRKYFLAFSANTGVSVQDLCLTHWRDYLALPVTIYRTDSIYTLQRRSSSGKGHGQGPVTICRPSFGVADNKHDMYCSTPYRSSRYVFWPEEVCGL